jgi:hypothetical protein
MKATTKKSATTKAKTVNAKAPKKTITRKSTRK